MALTVGEVVAAVEVFATCADDEVGEAGSCVEPGSGAPLPHAVKSASKDMAKSRTILCFTVVSVSNKYEKMIAQKRRARWYEIRGFQIRIRT